MNALVSRRTLLGSAAACLPFALGARPLHFRPYEAETAPDAVSRLVLSRLVTKIDAGSAGPVDFKSAVHRNFAQVIEQNFARLSATDARILVARLSDAELNDLSTLYQRSLVEFGRQNLLLSVLAARLPVQDLSRIAHHFGYAQTYAAIGTAAPRKLQEFDFLLASNTGQTHTRPLMGRGTLVPEQAGSPNTTPIAEAGDGKYLRYTPKEIYLDFRTAPVGALGVTGALWETTLILSRNLTAAYAGGYYFGQYYINPLLETYFPSGLDWLGSKIAFLVDRISASWSGTTSDRAAAQQSTAQEFQASPQQQAGFSVGGDYDVCPEWQWIAYSGPGGGSRDGDGCWRSGCYPRRSL